MSDDDDDRRSKFVWGPDDLIPTQCALCDRYGSGRIVAVCQAFPGSIPADIMANRADHRRPFEGDQGLRFRPRADAEPGMLARLFASLDELPDAAPVPS
jgi:hypothetical protein